MLSCRGRDRRFVRASRAGEGSYRSGHPVVRQRDRGQHHRRYRAASAAGQLDGRARGACGAPQQPPTLGGVRGRGDLAGRLSAGSPPEEPSRGRGSAVRRGTAPRRTLCHAGSEFDLSGAVAEAVGRRIVGASQLRCRQRRARGRPRDPCRVLRGTSSGADAAVLGPDRGGGAGGRRPGASSTRGGKRFGSRSRRAPGALRGSQDRALEEPDGGAGGARAAQPRDGSVGRGNGMGNPRRSPRDSGRYHFPRGPRERRHLAAARSGRRGCGGALGRQDDLAGALLAVPRAASRRACRARARRLADDRPGGRAGDSSLRPGTARGGTRQG